MTETPQPATGKAFMCAYDPRCWKFAVFLGLLALVTFAPEGTRDAAQGALADAYVQVSSFVGLTLLLFYTLEHVFKVDTEALLKKHQRWHVPLAALMGALPGCGGAIIVITQYVLGRLSFGGMVAVLTSTMGDAAFLLLAREPKTALLVMAISIVVGTITGLIVDKIHGRDFMRSAEGNLKDYKAHCGPGVCYPRGLAGLWYGLLVPGIALGIGAAFQLDTDLWFGPWAGLGPTHYIGLAGALLCFGLWAGVPDKGFAIVNLMAHPVGKAHVVLRDRVIFETSFVTAWVIAAFLLFELGSYWTAFDLEALFKATAVYLPAMAVLIGFIPGCGPQIIITTLYVSGLIPLSAQLGNAISNDGDALFPAIALAPRTAILATLYTAIPALLVGYGYYFLFE
ncbi:MAG: arsenic efflux protein [Rhodospirillales bacterium]|nr:arsenic efflux protein [Rhodospirillales bacterium]MCB9996260.1 arsenic efflux protein [Rhodospirillales bacterium]